MGHFTTSIFPCCLQLRWTNNHLPLAAGLLLLCRTQATEKVVVKLKYADPGHWQVTAKELMLAKNPVKRHLLARGLMRKRGWAGGLGKNKGAGKHRCGGVCGVLLLWSFCGATLLGIMLACET